MVASLPKILDLSKKIFMVTYSLMAAYWRLKIASVNSKVKHQLSMVSPPPGMPALER
jgi:hypothetical protein